MKKILALVTMAFLGGCQVANDVKDGIANAPSTFWDNVKEVLMFVYHVLVGALTSWVGSLFN